MAYLDTVFTDIHNDALVAFKNALLRLPLFSHVFEARNVGLVEVPLVTDGKTPDTNAAHDATHSDIIGTDEVDTAKVTINKEARNGFDIPLAKLSTQNSLVNREVFKNLATLKVNNLAKKVVDDLYGVVKASNFSGKFDVNSESWTLDDAETEAVVLREANFPIPGTVGILGYPLFSRIGKTSNLDGMVRAGLVKIEGDGTIIRTMNGVPLYHAVALPDNNEDLLGFFGSPDALAIAICPYYNTDDLVDGDLPPGTIIENLTDGDTGLTLQMYRFFDANKARWIVNFAIRYGMGVGNAAALRRLVEAGSSSGSGSSSSGN